ncbi:MAG: hypothetical protein ACI4SF_16435 [Oscillospiraceae bacterium]
MRKYEVLAAYIYNHREKLQSDVDTLQNNIRYRKVSQVDCLELIIAQERLAAFVEFCNDIRHILSLKTSETLSNGVSERSERVRKD